MSKEFVTIIDMSKEIPDWSNLLSALQEQRRFSDKFFDTKNLSNQQKQEMLKTFVLSLHSEATGIVDAVNYKDHRGLQHPIDVQKILYKSVDAYRYVLAILNLWDIDVNVFTSALEQKDDYLHFRHKLSSRRLMPNQKVVLFDLDDVVAEFRASFCEYASRRIGTFVDPNSDEYYNLRTFKQQGADADEVFKSFIDTHGFLGLGINKTYARLLGEFKAEGRWVQIVTARPADNLTCFYDTYSWLARFGFDVDGVTFTPEKFRWLSEQPFYGKNEVIAVDDSAKHAAEYAKHGVPVIVPQQPYNAEVAGLNNIIYVERGFDPYASAQMFNI